LGIQPLLFLPWAKQAHGKQTQTRFHQTSGDDSNEN
jgi:hypothetical protein